MRDPMSKPVSVVDLFAGPGGLGEGFASFPLDGDPLFRISLSIEKEEWAHRTLLLRSFYRLFPRGEAPHDYYRHLRGEISQTELLERYPAQAECARMQSQCMEIRPSNRRKVRRLIADRVAGLPVRANRTQTGRVAWVLIGGPPCQAYSVIGRSRMIGADRRDNTHKYEADPRHTLYKEDRQADCGRQAA